MSISLPSLSKFNSRRVSKPRFGLRPDLLLSDASNSTKENDNFDAPCTKFIEHLVDAIQSCLCCPICDDVFRKPKMLPCGHAFCSSCLSHWFLLTPELSCPVCRKFLQKNQIPLKLHALKALLKAFKRLNRFRKLPSEFLEQRHYLILAVIKALGICFERATANFVEQHLVRLPHRSMSSSSLHFSYKRWTFRKLVYAVSEASDTKILGEAFTPFPAKETRAAKLSRHFASVQGSANAVLRTVFPLYDLWRKGVWILKIFISGNALVRFRMLSGNEAAWFIVAVALFLSLFWLLKVLLQRGFRPYFQVVMQLSTFIGINEIFGPVNYFLLSYISSCCVQTALERRLRNLAAFA